MSQVRIVCDGPTPADARVYVDGRELDRVVKVEWSAQVGDSPRAVIHVLAVEVDVVADEPEMVRIALPQTTEPPAG